MQLSHVIQTHIDVERSLIEGVQHVTYSRYLVHQSHGVQGNNQLLYYIHVKLKTYQDPMQHVKQFQLNRY